MRAEAHFQNTNDLDT